MNQYETSLSSIILHIFVNNHLVFRSKGSLRKDGLGLWLLTATLAIMVNILEWRLLFLHLYLGSKNWELRLHSLDSWGQILVPNVDSSPRVWGVPSWFSYSSRGIHKMHTLFVYFFQLCTVPPLNQKLLTQGTPKAPKNVTFITTETQILLWGLYGTIYTYRFLMYYREARYAAALEVPSPWVVQTGGPRSYPPGSTFRPVASRSRCPNRCPYLWTPGSSRGWDPNPSESSWWLGMTGGPPWCLELTMVNNG